MSLFPALHFGIGHIELGVRPVGNTHSCICRREESIEGRSSIFLEDMTWVRHRDFNQGGTLENDDLVATWTDSESDIDKLFL